MKVSYGVLFVGIIIGICGAPANALRSLRSKAVESAVIDGAAQSVVHQRRLASTSELSQLDPQSVPEDSEERGPARKLAAVWPSPTGSVRISEPIHVYDEFNGDYKRYYGLGDGGDYEFQPAIFRVHPGGVVRNVIIGTPAGNGIYCLGSCKLFNVWWEDVGEDAATLSGKDPNQVMEINGGGARGSTDKCFQHNGPGTMIIKNFRADDLGKLYRSCGSCPNEQRHVIIQNVFLTNIRTAVAGINVNNGDTARFSDITIGQSKHIDICQKYRTSGGGSDRDGEGGGPDGSHCFFDPSTVKYTSPDYNPGSLVQNVLLSSGGRTGRRVRRSRARKATEKRRGKKRSRRARGLRPCHKSKRCMRLRRLRLKAEKNGKRH